MSASIAAINFALPESILTNDELAALYEGWSATKILQKTGIRERRIAAPGECSSDLAVRAAQNLFQSGAARPDEVDFLLFASQTPDYILPTTACLLQDRLGIPKSTGALDFNLGCSAFIYGLSLAKGLIAGGVARCVLLLTAETYSKLIHPRDKSVRTLFGDGAAATLIRSDTVEHIGDFVLGTDGSRYRDLIVAVGGMREPKSAVAPAEQTDESGNVRTAAHLHMDGPAILDFTLTVVPRLVSDVLARNGMTMDQVDLFVFHQANRFVLDTLRKTIRIPAERFYINVEDCGNTVSASIPIALSRAHREGRLKKGDRVMLVGFGVGLSWGATIVEWGMDPKAG